jgi:hypothetical protein
MPAHSVGEMRLWASQFLVPLYWAMPSPEGILNTVPYGCTGTRTEYCATAVVAQLGSRAFQRGVQKLLRVSGTRAAVAGSLVGCQPRIPSPQGILAGGAMSTRRPSQRASAGTARGTTAHVGARLPPVAPGFLPTREGRRRGSASTPIQERQAEFRRLSASVDDLTRAPEQAAQRLTAVCDTRLN